MQGQRTDSKQDIFWFIHFIHINSSLFIEQFWKESQKCRLDWQRPPTAQYLLLAACSRLASRNFPLPMNAILSVFLYFPIKWAITKAKPVKGKSTISMDKMALRHRMFWEENPCRGSVSNLQYIQMRDRDRCRQAANTTLVARTRGFLMFLLMQRGTVGGKRKIGWT